jgi:hypothetical protein
LGTPRLFLVPIVIQNCKAPNKALYLMGPIINVGTGLNQLKQKRNE